MHKEEKNKIKSRNKKRKQSKQVRPNQGKWLKGPKAHLPKLGHMTQMILIVDQKEVNPPLNTNGMNFQAMQRWLLGQLFP